MRALSGFKGGVCTVAKATFAPGAHRLCECKKLSRVRREPENGGDPFGEGADLKALEEFLLKRNVESLEAQRIKEALATFPIGGERLLTWEQRESCLLS